MGPSGKEGFEMKNAGGRVQKGVEKKISDPL